MGTSKSGGDRLDVGHFSGGAWTFDFLTGSATAARLAIGENGTIYVAYAGDGPTGRGLILATNTGAAWSHAVITPVSSRLPEHLDIAIGGNDEPWIAWHDLVAEKLVLHTPAGAEEVDPSWISTADYPVELAIDSSGRPHVVYRHDEALDRAILHARRDNGTWVIERLFEGQFNGDGDLAIATGPAGEVTIAAIQDSGGVVIVDYRHGRRYIQSVYDECFLGELDATYVGGTLHVAHNCAGVRVTRPIAEHFPADYAATCAAIPTTQCTAACGCGAGCCIEGSSCISPQSGCESHFQTTICSDATIDPALVYTCSAGIGTPTCTGNAASVSAACTPLFLTD